MSVIDWKISEGNEYKRLVEVVRYRKKGCGEEIAKIKEIERLGANRREEEAAIRKVYERRLKEEEEYDENKKTEEEDDKNWRMKED